MLLQTTIEYHTATAKGRVSGFQETQMEANKHRRTLLLHGVTVDHRRPLSSHIVVVKGRVSSFRETQMEANENGTFGTFGGFHAQRNGGKQTQSPFAQSWKY
ncbi:hypothetical protein DEO72_LG8g2531 [Vigna unguiculata]|uniref:Uncharacterized protein n=1 Tax=Vigna unguiculata TaxID=3917 RepID=A0A4D6MX85_VIGUN|nr:hypothetical protein DEO72_LG8g2531 [Vigna unguiculata]